MEFSLTLSILSQNYGAKPDPSRRGQMEDRPMVVHYDGSKHWNGLSCWTRTLGGILVPGQNISLPAPVGSVLFASFKYLDRALLENALNGVVCRLPLPWIILYVQRRREGINW